MFFLPKIFVVLFLLARPPQVQTIHTLEAKAHVGRIVKVCGVLRTVKTAPRSSGRPTFLNFNNEFTAVIWQWQRHRFPNLQAKIGREACVIGEVRLYRDRAQMTLTKAEQLHDD